MMKSAIFFATYPIDDPRHGGQIRSAAIFNCLKEHGWNVAFFCIYEARSFPNTAINDWRWDLAPSTLLQVDNGNARPDIDACDGHLDNQESITRLSDLIMSFGPAMIIMEQPWLWPLVKTVLVRSKLQNVPVIYSSQNIEQDLIADLVRSHRNFDMLSYKAKKIEDDLVKASAAIIAVSDSDVSRLLELGNDGNDKPSKVVKNGVWPQHFSQNTLRSISERTKGFEYLLFVGSAHPPNATGFEKLLHPHLAYLNPNQKIVIVGGVCSLMPGIAMYREFSGISYARILQMGVVTNEELGALLALAKGIILPISEGGGTNLKTAEALYSRLPLVATSKALRGFEEFLKFPTVCIADGAPAFKEGIQQLFASSKQIDLSLEDKNRLQSVTWENSLSGLPLYLEHFVTKAGPISSIYESMQPVLAFGWHGPESDFAWTSAKEACLYFHGGDFIRGDITVSFEYEIYRADAHAATLRIFCKDRLILEEIIDDTSTRRVVCDVSETDLYPDGSLELFLVLDRIISPSEFGDADVRSLGMRVGLSSIKFSAPSGRNQGDILLGHPKKASRSLADRTRGAGLRYRLKSQIDTIDGIVVSTMFDIPLTNIEFRRPVVRGWAYLKASKQPLRRIQMILAGTKNITIREVSLESRPDVSRALGESGLQESGFSFRFPVQLPEGSFRLLISGEDAYSNRKVYATPYLFVVS